MLRISVEDSIGIMTRRRIYGEIKPEQEGFHNSKISKLKFYVIENGLYELVYTTIYVNEV